MSDADDPSIDGPPIPFSESPPPRLYQKCEGSTHRFLDGATRCRCGRVGATLLNRPSAAPLSTLPERPDEINVAEVRADAKRQLPLDSYSTLMLCDELESLRSRLSSLERELDGVRKERDQWHKAAESTLRLVTANAALRERSE